MLDLTNFIEDEMIFFNDPLFFREAVRKYENKPLKPHKPKKIQSYAIQETSGNKKKETLNAQYKMASMILRSAQQFWTKLLRIEDHLHEASLLWLSRRNFEVT